jgi:26 proteasome complex subunit DSS1
MSLIFTVKFPIVFCFHHTDWNDSETDLAHLGGAQPGAAKSGGDKLWEDNWDDDDIEDEFSVQLR